MHPALYTSTEQVELLAKPNRQQFTERIATVTSLPRHGKRCMYIFSTVRGELFCFDGWERGLLTLYWITNKVADKAAIPLLRDSVTSLNMFTMCNYNKEVVNLDYRVAGVRNSIQDVGLKLSPKLSIPLRKQENRRKRIDSDCFTKIIRLIDSKRQDPHMRPRWPQLSKPLVTFRLTFVCVCMSR